MANDNPKWNAVTGTASNLEIPPNVGGYRWLEIYNSVASEDNVYVNLNEETAEVLTDGNVELSPGSSVVVDYKVYISAISGGSASVSVWARHRYNVPGSA